MKKSIQVIAFYLPQFYPIPENDKWWGIGFTEWMNVTKAKPLFNKHEQPKLPSELGFYDLRVSETRERQAALAKQHGISAFCYWHYWFGNGKRILNRVFDEVVASRKPDFPFCLAWANQSWTGHWHGNRKDVLIEQKYGGEEDFENHFYELLNAFKDERYLKIENKPIFLVYNPWDIPNPQLYTKLWNQLAIKNGLDGIFFIAMDQNHANVKKYGMHGSTWHEPVSHHKINEPHYIKLARKVGFREHPKRFKYSDYVKYTLNADLAETQYPMVIPNWDNTPRSQKNGLVYLNSTPELFKTHFEKAVKLIQHKPKNDKIIFVKAWNEWAEGNYLEPDQKYGNLYLEALKGILSRY